MKKRNKSTKKEIQRMLKAAMKHIQSIPYSASLRWVFYRLLDDNIYKNKKDYNRFKARLSKARKNFEITTMDDIEYQWAPDTLIDETRESLPQGYGAPTKEEWAKNELENAQCKLSKHSRQKYFVMVLFEAKAMKKQFQYYIKNIPLYPFGGDVSIPFKYEIAKDIEQADELYHLPIKLLYFGDRDDKGEQIYKSAMVDIRKWCKVEFESIWCGLTKEQAIEMNIPENFEKPGQYQWEGLTDEQAYSIIKPNIDKYHDKEIDRQIAIEEKEATIWFKEKMGIA